MIAGSFVEHLATFHNVACNDIWGRSQYARKEEKSHG